MDETTGTLGADEYEFNDSQNEVFRTLASAMSFVGLIGVAFGSLALLFGLLAFFSRAPSDGTAVASPLVIVVQGVLSILIGNWTRGAARSIGKIVETRGSDIANLMSAMVKLRSVYQLQRVIIVIALVVVLLALVFAAIMAAK